MAALPALLELGVAEFDALVKAGRIDPETEHILCHFSAEHLRRKIFRLLRAAGQRARRRALVHQPSHGGQHRRGQHLRDARRAQAPAEGGAIGCSWVVPESGRFTLAFAHLTCVEPSGKPAGAGRRRRGWQGRRSARPRPTTPRSSPLRWGGLAEVWAEFPARPCPGYRSSGGSRTGRRRSTTTGGCCSTCASRWWTGRAVDLARGRELLDRPVLAAQRRHQARRRRAPRLSAARTRLRGGRGRPGGHGVAPPPTSARARCPRSSFTGPGQPDPVDLLGAMFVIEGLGLRKAGLLGGPAAGPASGCSDDQVSFLRYHATGDDEHFGLLTARAAVRGLRRRRDGADRQDRPGDRATVRPAA